MIWRPPQLYEHTVALKNPRFLFILSVGMLNELTS